MPEQVLLNLYYSFIYPYFIYANVIWGGACDSNLNCLRLLQNKVVRILTDSNYFAHTDPLFL